MFISTIKNIINNKITKIIFSFVTPLPNQSTVEKGLEKTWLYNHPILTERTGKTFTLKMKRWKLENEHSYLTLNDDWDFDLDSFQEKSRKNNDSPPPIQSQKGINNLSNDNSNALKIFFTSRRNYWWLNFSHFRTFIFLEKKKT